jgi:hypothetical protein
MLEVEGLNFKPEFVAKVVTNWLKITMFDEGQAEMQKYHSSSTFDFGMPALNRKCRGHMAILDGQRHLCSRKKQQWWQRFQFHEGARRRVVRRTAYYH